MRYLGKHDWEIGWKISFIKQKKDQTVKIPHRKCTFTIFSVMVLVAWLLWLLVFIWGVMFLLLMVGRLFALIWGLLFFFFFLPLNSPQLLFIIFGVIFPPGLGALYERDYGCWMSLIATSWLWVKVKDGFLLMELVLQLLYTMIASRPLQFPVTSYLEWFHIYTFVLFAFAFLLF